jgi:hypothetical protein
MNRPPSLRLLVLSLLFTALLTGGGRSDDPKRHAAERTSESRPPAPASSPEALAERFLTGLLEGDEDSILSCYDRTTDAGRAEAEVFRLAARQIAVSRAAEKAARKKFGEKGLAVVRDELGVQLGEFQDRHKVQGFVDKLRKSEMEFFFTRPGDKAVVKVPGSKGPQWWEFERKGSRWFMSANEGEMGLAIAGTVFGKMDEFYQKVPKIIANSESAEGLRKQLQEAKKAASIQIKPAR